MAEFFDREREIEHLEGAWSRQDPQLVTLFGRRRAGKTTLLSRFAQGKRAIYLYGTRISERDILAGLSLQAADLFEEPYLRSAPFPGWPVALEYLAARSRKERLLVIFDEFPYLCDVSPGLDTVIQRWWDQLPQGANLMLVLGGSGFSFMEGLTGARGPLHGRRTGQVEVHPFDYLDASRFFPSLSSVDRVRAYACLGGIPAYLRHWHDDLGLSDNLCDTVLSPGHFLFREGEELLRTEFHQEAMYASILRAVATGEERPSDIARAVGKHSAEDIFDHLRRLQELRFLRREVPVTETERPRTYRVLYRLADPYLRFWFRYVLPFQSFLQLGKGREVWTQEIEPNLDEFVGRTTWEEVCKEYLWRRLGVGGLPIRFAQLGRYWDGQEEIDMVGLWRSKATIVGACKWTAKPMDSHDLSLLERKAEKLDLDRSPLWVLASRSGFTPDLRRRSAGGSILLVEPADLFG